MTSKTFASVSRTKSNLPDLKKLIEKISKTAIYVGIPEEGKRNTRPVPGEPTNAELGFKHEFGSPAEHIPPRPFLEPGVKQDKEKISSLMRKAVKQALKGDDASFDKGMEAAAMTAAASVKTYMAEADFAPLAPMTIQMRLKKHPNDDPSQMQPLIDTGSLRNAIEGVVVKED